MSQFLRRENVLAYMQIWNDYIRLQEADRQTRSNQDIGDSWRVLGQLQIEEKFKDHFTTKFTKLDRIAERWTQAVLDNARSVLQRPDAQGYHLEKMANYQGELYYCPQGTAPELANSVWDEAPFAPFNIIRYLCHQWDNLDGDELGSLLEPVIGWGLSAMKKQGLKLPSLPGDFDPIADFQFSICLVMHTMAISPERYSPEMVNRMKGFLPVPHTKVHVTTSVEEYHEKVFEITDLQRIDEIVTSHILLLGAFEGYARIWRRSMRTPDINKKEDESLVCKIYERCVNTEGLLPLDPYETFATREEASVASTLARDLFQHLTESEIRVWWATDIIGKRRKEVAALLNLPENAVKNDLESARNTLRNWRSGNTRRRRKAG